MSRASSNGGAGRSAPERVADLGDNLLDMVDHLGRPATRRRLGRAGLRPVLVAAALVSIVAGLVVSVFAVAGVVYGVRAVADQLRPARSAAPSYPPETVSMKILTNSEFGPRYTNADWTVHKGQTVILRITNFDDGAAPLMGFQVAYDNVEGTVGAGKACTPTASGPGRACSPVSTETVDGHSVAHLPNSEVSHTFTVPALGLNLPIPLAPSGKGVTVVARFVATRTGTFTWQCYAPCGSGQSGMGGAMSVPGWMEGKVTVLA